MAAMKPVDSLLANTRNGLATQGPGKSATRAGRAGGVQGPAQTASTGGNRDHVDAINQVFAELELAYHNQFHKAFGQEGALALAKKYWLGVLAEYRPEVILRAVRHVVRSSEYLPSLAAITRACEDAHALFGLPTPQAAYVEACCAAEPKAAQRWSHPAVFLAGQATGWHTLAGEPRTKAFPLFDYHYGVLCRAVIDGEQLELPRLKALPEKVEVPLSREENLARLQQLKKTLESDPL